MIIFYLSLEMTYDVFSYVYDGKGYANSSLLLLKPWCLLPVSSTAQDVVLTAEDLSINNLPEYLVNM